MQFGMTSSDEAGEMSPRHAGIQQHRVQCLSSDADYTSSSEQSCDTVIYVGKNGRVLSDRELTDNEGPPPLSKPPVPTTTVTSASSDRRPTTSGKLSGVSGVSVGCHGNSGLIMPLSTGNVMACSPAVGCAEELSHLTRTSGSSQCELTPGTKAGGENASTDCLGAAVKLRKTPLSRCGAPPTDGATERWIDGPPSAQQFPDVQAASVAAVVGGDGADDTGEMWVDGPAEFQKDPNSLVESHKSPMKLRKSKCAKLYRARAAAVAAAATNADDADANVTPKRPPEDSGEATRKDSDISEFIGVMSIAAMRQLGVDQCQSRHKTGALGDQTRLLTTTAIDSVAATHGKTEELSRCLGHRRLSGRKQTNHATLASFYSPDRGPASAQSSPGHRLRPTGGQSTAVVKGGVRCGDRTAQWVRSVQVATAAAAVGVTPPSSSHFTRPMSPLKSHSVDRVLRGRGTDLLGGLRAWHDDSASDDAVTAVSNNSPPPDYATCVAADLERHRRHSRHLSSPTTNLDINENLQANGTSSLSTKLLPISLTPLHVAGWSPLYSYSVAPVTGVETINNRTSTSGCQQLETVYDPSTWPRRQDYASLSFAVVDVDNEVTSSPCKRLHHPDGASNPQLSEEVTRSDVIDPADCCKLLTSLNDDADSSTAISTSFRLSSTHHQCCPADKADVLQCRHFDHSVIQPTSPALTPSCVPLTVNENGSNLSTSGANEDPWTTGDRDNAMSPTSNSSKAAPSTRAKAPSSPSKAASPKRNKSGMSLLWCIYPRGSKSRSSKSGQQTESTCPDGESTNGADHQRQQLSTVVVDTRHLASDSVVGDRSTDSDHGSSVSECTPPSALDLVRRLCNGDDDASSDYWSAKASADHLPSTPHLISTTSHIPQTDGKLPSLELFCEFSIHLVQVS